MNRVEQYLADKLKERKQEGNLRQLTTHKASVDLYSNDYLGLVTTGAFIKMQNAASLAAGSTGSRLLSGNSQMAERLEHTIANFHKAEAALIFNSGYDANIGLMASIAGRNTTILSDQLCHASLIDGIRLSQCSRRYKFRHNDINDLEHKIKKYKGEGPILVVIESIYSMDGDAAPLKEIVELCEMHDAQLVVDEAHATGVFGERGAGLVCASGLQDKVFARIHTFGKALGCHGAAVVGSSLLKQYLINFARSFIYTTALPAHSVYSAYCAYQHLSAHDFTNEPLHDLIRYFNNNPLKKEDERWIASISPIQALVVGDTKQSKALADKLQRAGLQVSPILHPTVPAGMERLRVCLHMFNTTEQVDFLFAYLQLR